MKSFPPKKPVDFEIEKEVWNMYELPSDNAYLKTRIVVVSVYQTSNEKAPNEVEYSGEISNIHSIVPFENFSLYGQPSSKAYGKDDFEKGRSIKVEFKIITEDWNVYRLRDGTKITVRQVVASVKRMLDMYDSHGTPIYVVDSTNIIHVESPEKR